MPVIVYYNAGHAHYGYTWYHPRRECYLAGRLIETELVKFECDDPENSMGWHNNASRCAACGEYVNWPTEQVDDQR